jgi:threonine dehydratase
VLSGGNIDQRLLASVLLRDLVRTGRLARLRIALHDTVGSLAKVTALIAEAGGNVVDVAHQRVFSTLPAKDTSLEVAIETMDARRLQALVEALRAEGYAVEVLDGPGRPRPMA